MRKALYGALSAAASLAALLGMAGCGLESFMLLQPPTANQSPPPGKFQFYAGSENNEFEFLGFELYYKFYHPSDSADDYINISSFEQLLARSFRRLNNADSNIDNTTSISKPLFLSKDFKGTPYDVTIDFSNSEEPKVSSSVVGLPQRAITGLRRGVALPPPYASLWKPFYTFSGDPLDMDITSSIYDLINAPSLVRLVVFALSYGKDVSGLELYSQPVFLGDQALIFSNRSYNP